MCTYKRTLTAPSRFTCTGKTRSNMWVTILLTSSCSARSHSHRACRCLATTSSPTAVTRKPPYATSPHDGFLSSASLQWSRSHTRTTHRQLSHHHGNFLSSANSFGSRTLSSQRTSCRAGPFINNTCPHGSIQVYISTHTGKTHVPTCVLLHTSSCSAVTATEPFIALLQLRHSGGQRAAARDQPT